MDAFLEVLSELKVNLRTDRSGQWQEQSTGHILRRQRRSPPATGGLAANRRARLISHARPQT